MDARVTTLTATSTDTVTLFTGSSGAGLHRVYFHNTNDTLPVVLYLRVQEGATGQLMTLRKIKLEPKTDTKWIGSIGSDDSFIIEAHNPYASSIVSDEIQSDIVTEDGYIIGDSNDLTFNYNWW